MMFREVSLSVFFIVFFYGQCALTETVPQLSVPPDIIIECNTTTPDITGYPNVSGNCNGSIEVNYHDVVESGSIYTIVRNWTATDSCGVASASQIIQVSDDTAPNIYNPPSFLTWCDYIFGSMGENITDNCDDLQDLKINYTNTPPSPNLACPEDYAFSQIWNAVDQSGNDAMMITRIAVQVVTAITWEYIPGPLTVVCTSGVYPNTTGMAIAFDQCSRLVPVTWEDSVSHYCNIATPPYQFQRTFIAMRCGVQMSYVQIIDVLPGDFPPDTQQPQSTEDSSNGTLQVPPPSPSLSVQPSSSVPPVPTAATGGPSGPTPSECSCPNGFCFGGTECITCQTGFFGPNCVQKCFCLNGLCDDGVNGNGYCVVCKQGYYGVACDTPCSCTNGVCNDGPDEDGSCLGCSKGYYGVNCQMKCICDEDACDDGPTGTGVCLNSLYVTQSSSPNTLAPFLVGVIVLLIFLFIFFVGLAIGLFLYYRFKNEKHLYEISLRSSKAENRPLVMGE